LGISAAMVQVRPKKNAPPTTKRILGRLRLAESSAPATLPTAMMELSRPNSLAPMPNSTVAMVEVKMAKLKPNVPTRNTVISTATMSGRFQTYRKPASSWPRSREALGCFRSCFVRSSVMANTVKPKVTALIRNTHPAPTATVSRPATAGPIRRAPLKEAELSATAFERLSSGTSSETKVCRAGASIAATTPRPRAKR
jgi:hypothetical protein